MVLGVYKIYGLWFRVYAWLFFGGGVLLGLGFRVPDYDQETSAAHR